jgi:hypothetical protein
VVVGYDQCLGEGEVALCSESRFVAQRPRLVSQG